METNTKEVYAAPVIETVEIRVEQGFQMSGGPSPSYMGDTKDGHTW